MSFPTFFMERLRHLGVAAKWLAIIAPMAALVGTLCVGFLWALDWVTEQRFAHPELLFGLPVAGVLVGPPITGLAARRRVATT